MNVQDRVVEFNRQLDPFIEESRKAMSGIDLVLKQIKEKWGSTLLASPSSLRKEGVTRIDKLKRDTQEIFSQVDIVNNMVINTRHFKAEGIEIYQSMGKDQKSLCEKELELQRSVALLRFSGKKTSISKEKMDTTQHRLAGLKKYSTQLSQDMKANKVAVESLNRLLTNLMELKGGLKSQARVIDRQVTTLQSFFHITDPLDAIAQRYIHFRELTDIERKLPSRRDLFFKDFLHWKMNLINWIDETVIFRSELKTLKDQCSSRDRFHALSKAVEGQYSRMDVLFEDILYKELELTDTLRTHFLSSAKKTCVVAADGSKQLFFVWRKNSKEIDEKAYLKVLEKFTEVEKLQLSAIIHALLQCRKKDTVKKIEIAKKELRHALKTATHDKALRLRCTGKTSASSTS
jgi:hypothetical protein